MNREFDVISMLRRRFRKHRMLLLEVSLFAIALLAISAWQSRNLLDTDRQLAPALLATTLAGDRFELSHLAGKPVLIYFFAPWCPYCSASADNIVRLRRIRDEEDLTILMVALDWQDRDEISEYAIDHELNVPVLLGDAAVARDWRVFSFPTYYMLDDELRVIGRDMGYSTQLGLLWRSWIVK
jgi:thiol-disulfide isomerase/thioredoxin